MNRRRFLTGIASIGAIGVGAHQTYNQTIRTPDSRTGRMLLGVSPEDPDLERLGAMERWMGKQHAIVVRFFDLGVDTETIEANVDGGLTTIWRAGYVPQLMLQPFFGEDPSTEITREIADGEHNDRINEWARAVSNWVNQGRRAHNRRVYLTLAPEMNGDWAPWSPAAGDTTEEDFVDMWHTVHGAFTEAGMNNTNAQWIWAVNAGSRGVSIHDCYPGDEYVDWLSIHGYNWENWGGWTAPGDIYDSALGALRGLSDHPVAITEFGCSSEVTDGSDPAKKDEWISQAFSYFRDNDIRMACIFNIDKETDWAIFGGQNGAKEVRVDGEQWNTYPAYREAITDPGMLGRNPDHPQHLSDSEFAGKFDIPE